jgi:hypothetical protein
MFSICTDGCYERDIEKLEKIQLEAARIVTGLTKIASKDSFLLICLDCSKAKR